jgi:hypothetical protein
VAAQGAAGDDGDQRQMEQPREHQVILRLSLYQVGRAGRGEFRCQNILNSKQQPSQNEMAVPTTGCTEGHIGWRIATKFSVEKSAQVTSCFACSSYDASFNVQAALAPQLLFIQALNDELGGSRTRKWKSYTGIGRGPL